MSIQCGMLDQREIHSQVGMIRDEGSGPLEMAVSVNFIKCLFMKNLTEYFWTVIDHV